MANNRSNNGRVTPDSVVNNAIQVSATPVNKLQTFRPDISNVQKTKATYEGLANIGKGTMAMAVSLSEQSEANILNAYLKTEAKNRQQWAEVSKHIEGMAKFNPYNKDAYNQILSVEEYRKVYNNVLATPDIKRKTPQEIDAMIEDSHQSAIANLQKLGVPERAYAQYQIDFDNKMTQLKHNYVQAHAEEEYTTYKNTESNEFAANLYNKYATNPKANKIGLLQSSLSDLMANLEKTGTPNKTKVEVITNAISKALSIDASMFNAGDIENALRQMRFYNGHLTLGQYGQGNIDLYNRPQVKMKDGTIATVRSMSFNDGKNEVLIPTVSDDGKLLTDEEAIKQYRETGKYLGKFSSVEEANNYADLLHNEQDIYYHSQRFEDLTEHGYADIKQLVMAAKEAQYKEQRLAYEQDQFNRQVTADKAMDEMMNYIIKNPNASGAMFKSQAQSIIQKYGVQGTQMLKFMGDVANGEKLWTEFSDTPSSPEIRNMLYRKAIDGTLSTGELGQYVGDGINSQDAINLYSMIDKEKEKQQTAGLKYVDGHIKNAQKEMIGGSKDFMTPLYGDTEAQTSFNQRLAIIKQQYLANCKTMGTEQAQIIANNSIANLKMNFKNYKTLQANERNIKSNMKSVQTKTSKYIYSISNGSAAKTYNYRTAPVMQGQAKKTILNMNFVHGGKITSTPQLNRVINGRKAPHTGWDIAAAEGSPVYARGTGIVTQTGYTPSTGNYCIITYSNGTQVRAMHFQNNSMPHKNQIVTPTTIIGRVGQTGHTTGACVHLEFYRQGRNIDPYQGILN